jgi:fructose-1,6-bisphosphatase/inositol monophosphatase family enzyme
VARGCVRAGAKIALEGFKLPRLAGVKGRGNIVTETDFAVESRIHEIIRASFPDHNILSEETRAATPPEGWVWVVDPIDGTKNFAMGIPVWCINVALCFDGKPVLGLTYDPLRREEVLALAGAGLKVNSRLARASAVATVYDSVIGVGMGFNDERGETTADLMKAIWPNVQAFRDIGSAALGLAYAACGRFDLFVHHFLYPWDLAAGLVQITEGGGVVTDRDGNPVTLFSDSVLGGSPAAHADFLRLTSGQDWRGSG